MTKNTELWYREAASDFDHALPIGNGRIGGMVYGHVSHDLIGLNEDSVWSGGPRNRNNPNSLEGLPKIRELLRQERISEAEELAFQTMQGVTPNCRHYMPLGDLKLDIPHEEEQVSNYRRSLDLTTAIASLSYQYEGILYTREAFVSCPDNVMVIRFSADHPGSVNVNVCIDGRDDYYDDNRPMNANTIFMTGGSGGVDGICFASAIRMISENGVVKNLGMHLTARDCDEVTILVSIRTNYYQDDYVMQCISDVDKATALGFDALLQRHLDDYQPLFFRSELHLSDYDSTDFSALSTDERLVRLQKNPDRDLSQLVDNGLIEMYYNYGRYLMIAGSRPGTLPLNLQGIWNKDMWPAWGGRFTININTEMNYWPVEVTNLSECHLPLFDLIEKMRPNGRVTAREMYDCGGFVAHHNTDLWGDCAPQDMWMPATIWPMGAAWLCLHIYEHYRFTQDLAFLDRKYDTLKEAAEFFVDYLIENDQGQLVTCPSISPENVYLTEKGTKGSLCMGPSMDSEIIYELFSDVIASAHILERDGAFADKLTALRERLPKPEIGKYGQIKEWAVDYDEVEIGHRHISQLFALYPADQISPEKTPELAAAARATLERRLSHGGGHTGWSRAWIINFWARLLDAEQVFENMQLLLMRSTNMNMLDSHPPFQIDGNFGATAGIAEALLQSHSGEIQLLPALPRQWAKGYVSGLRARGGFEVSISWNEGVLTEADLLSIAGKTCTIRSASPITICCEERPVPTTKVGDTYTFYTEAGTHYSVVPGTVSETNF
jgi:alpha-L-fucosidase 2